MTLLPRAGWLAVVALVSFLVTFAAKGAAPQERLRLVPLPAPTLDQMDELVREQIQERQKWHRQMMEAPGARSSDQVLAYGELGMLYQAYGLFDAAEVCYRNAEQLAPDDHRWAYYLGLLYRARNEPEPAIASLERGLALAPDDVPTLVRLAEMRLDQNEPDRAAPLLEKAVTIDSENAVALAVLGGIALSRHDFGRAAHLLERALAIQPEASSLRSPLAMAYRALGDTDRASAQIEQYGAGQAALNDPLMRKLHGLARAQREHQQRGTSAIKAGQVNEAIAEFRQAVLEDPLYSLSRLNLALALMRTGDLEQAARELSEALRIDPDSPRAHLTLGYLREQQGAQLEAVEHYRASVAADPKYVDAWFSLAASLNQLGRHEAAAAAYAEVVRRRPDWTLVRLREANELILADRSADARARLEAATEAIPRDGYVAHALARLLATASEPAVRDGERALTIAEALFGARASVEHAETVAMALAELGRFDSAVRWQLDAIAIAERTGGDASMNLLQRRLGLYRDRQPCRAPWTDTGELVPFPPRGVTPASPAPNR